MTKFQETVLGMLPATPYQIAKKLVESGKYRSYTIQGAVSTALTVLYREGRADTETLDFNGTWLPIGGLFRTPGDLG